MPHVPLKFGQRPRALASRLPRFSGFDGHHGKQDQIYALLAPLARRGKAEAPSWFHSMPEVAAFFGVALRTVSAVYRRMEQEGLLARIRGVGTVLPARSGHLRPQTPARGVVAVLNWLPGFLHISDQRYFMMQLERRLWERNFATTPVFYHEEEKANPAFADRILAHRPDLVIWLTPGLDDFATMGTLRDAGVHLVAIADRPLPTRTPGYVIDWQRGLEAALQYWQAHGVKRAIIPSSPPPGINPLLPQLESLLRAQGLEFALCPAGTESMEEYVARLATEDAGVIFAYDIWHAQVCSQAPRAFARLLTQRRVLNCWSIPIDAGTLGDARTDAVLLPWSRIVDRIAEDLNTGAIFAMTADQVFDAEWTPQVPAARVSRLYDFETIEEPVGRGTNPNAHP